MNSNASKVTSTVSLEIFVNIVLCNHNLPFAALQREEGSFRMEMEIKELTFSERSAEKTKEGGKKEKEKVDDFMERVNKPYPYCTICKDKINKIA